MSKTKIICTLGPVSGRKTVLLRMIRAGMDVVRLNFSHGTLGEHLARIELLRALNKKYRRAIKILGDLEGPRVRVGLLKRQEPIPVKKNQLVWLTQENRLGEGDTIPFDYRGSLSRIKKGTPLYIDDGNIALRVEARERKRVRARVIIPGIIKERKGINMPDVTLDFQGLSPKDKLGLDFCVKNRIDFIAQSFVRNEEDMLILKKYLQKSRRTFRLIAKIESREGIRNIDSILRVSDGILIARGDMGISIPIYEVPIVQKQIIRKCNRAGKLVITATQMLESMTQNRIPTRAEVADVANAILDGSDYLMLSGETAVGSYPAECVELMNRIIRFTESQAGDVPRSAMPCVFNPFQSR